MFRTLSLVSALVLATAFSVSDGAAQAKKKSPQCVANFHDACMKRCLNGGGQPRCARNSARSASANWVADRSVDDGRGADQNV